MDKNIKIIYNKLENIKFNQGYVDLSNSSIQNENDIIEVCNIFRDPRYETFRIFYMKDNKIVAQEAITSKLPDCVVVFNKKTGEHIKAYEKMANRIKRLSADGYYLAHNHPSGIANPSKEDIQITKHFADNVNGFLSDYTVGAYSDKIIEIMHNKELYEKVSKNAYIDLYKTWKQMVDKAYELYKEFIEKKCN